MVNERNLIVALTVKYNGDFGKIIKAIKNKEVMSDNEIKKYNDMVLKDTKILYFFDKEYPVNLKSSFEPPLVLFYSGDISLLSNPRTIGVVGGKTYTTYGRKITEQLVNEMDKSLVVVGNASRETERIALKTAVKRGMKNISILSRGLSREDIYTAGKDLVISPFPLCDEKMRELGIEPVSYDKKMANMNKLLASIPNRLLATDIPNSKDDNSIPSIAILHALRQGKDVMAVPYPVIDIKDGHKIDNSNNRIIQDGATMVISGEDVNYIYHKELEKKEVKVKTSIKEKEVMLK